MIPGLGGMNPAQMKAMMRQLGIKSEELSVARATIELTDGTKLAFDAPQVTVVDMKGQKTYTLVGDAVEEAGEKIAYSAEDIEMVAEQTGVSHGMAEKALEQNDGDIAEAIASLKKE